MSYWQAGRRPSAAIDARTAHQEPKSGLGFCHGKKYFCQDSGKNRKNTVKTGKNWQ